MTGGTQCLLAGKCYSVHARRRTGSSRMFALNPEDFSLDNRSACQQCCTATVWISITTVGATWNLQCIVCIGGVTVCRLLPRRSWRGGWCRGCVGSECDTSSGTSTPSQAHQHSVTATTHVHSVDTWKHDASWKKLGEVIFFWKRSARNLVS